MQSHPPSYNQVVTENSTLPNYEEVMKDIKNEQRDNYCLYFIISILFIILLIVIPVILATLTNKNENV